MKSSARKYAVLVLFFLAVSVHPQASQRIELSLGSVISSKLFDFSISSQEIVNYKNVSIAYMVEYEKANLALGFWVGYLHNNPYTKMLSLGTSNIFSYPITAGIKIGFGSLDSIALSVNIGITPSLGLYAKDFFMNVFVGSWEDIFFVTSNNELKHFVVLLPYIEVGYSFRI